MDFKDFQSLRQEDLYRGLASWFEKRSSHVQSLAQFLNVYGAGKEDFQKLAADVKEQWNISFREQQKKKTETRLAALSKYSWVCNACSMRNSLQHSRCEICFKTKENSLSPPKNNLSTSWVPSLSCEEEAKKVALWSEMRMAAQAQEASTDLKKEQFFSVVQELEKERGVKLEPLPDYSGEQLPRYLLALVKGGKDESARVLIIDKLHQVIEWFDPVVRKSSDQKHLLIPMEVKELQSALSTLVPGSQWRFVANQIPNKLTDSKTVVDQYALWYATMRLGYDTVGGALSPQKLDTLSPSLTQLKSVHQNIFSSQK